MTDFCHIESMSRLSETLRRKVMADPTLRSLCGVIKIQPLRGCKRCKEMVGLSLRSLCGISTRRWLVSAKEASSLCTRLCNVIKIHPLRGCKKTVIYETSWVDRLLGYSLLDKRKMEQMKYKVSTKNRAFYVVPLQGVICNPIIYPRRCHWARSVQALSGLF